MLLNKKHLPVDNYEMECSAENDLKNTDTSNERFGGKCPERNGALKDSAWPPLVKQI